MNRVALMPLVVVLAAQTSGCDPCYPKNEAELGEVVDADAAGCDWLYVQDTGLTDLEGLRGLRDVAFGIIVRRNSALTSVSGIETLDRLPQIKIDGNPALEAIDIQLESESDEDSVLSIHGSPTASITLRLGAGIGTLELLELPPLGTIEVGELSSVVSLRLEDLETLQDLSGFSGVSAVSALTLRRLPGISRAEVEAFLAQLDEPPAGMDICGLADEGACPGDDLREMESDNPWFPWF